MKHILIASAQLPFQSGGAEYQVRALARRLREAGYACDTVHIPFQWRPIEQVMPSCLAWRTLDFTHAADVPVDLLICTKFPAYLARHPNKVAWLAHQFRQAYDLHDAGREGFPDSAEGRALRRQVTAMDTRMLSECRRLFTISHHNAARMQHYNGLTPEVLPLPLDAPEMYRCGAWEPYILSVGRLDSLKRTDLVIRALPHLPVHVRAVIVGRGDQQRDLEALASQLGVAERVRFAGYVSDNTLRDLYADCMAVCYAPLDEDYGLVTLEAFQSGKPVVTACDSGGVLEFVRHNETGLVCEPQARAVADAVADLAARPALARQLGANGRDAIRRITWERVVARLTETLA